MSRNNILIVVAGPSGVGKGTVCKKLFRHMDDLEFSVSATTRKAREGEKEGVNYFFVSDAKFDNMVKNEEFLEYADVFDNRYGTPKDYVFSKLKSGKDVLLEIDVQGAVMVMQSCRDAVFIFILPPSIEEQRNRLLSRGTECEEQLNLRMNKAKEEIGYAEKFDYIVINEDVDTADNEIMSIITSEKLKVSRNEQIIKELINS